MHCTDEFSESGSKVPPLGSSDIPETFHAGILVGLVERSSDGGGFLSKYFVGCCLSGVDGLRPSCRSVEPMLDQWATSNVEK